MVPSHMLNLDINAHKTSLIPQIISLKATFEIYQDPIQLTTFQVIPPSKIWEDVTLFAIVLYCPTWQLYYSIYQIIQRL